MEEKMKELMDQLTLEETERLLENRDMKIEMDQLAAARIKRAVYEKTGVKRDDVIANDNRTAEENRIVRARLVKQKRRIAAAAAVFFICAAAVAAVGPQNVSAAIRQFFGLAPGYGILEAGETPVRYVAKELSAAENEAVRMEMVSGVATEDTVTVMFRLTHLSLTQEEINQMSSDDWELLLMTDQMPKDLLLLRTEAGEYGEDSYSRAGGGMEELWSASFTLSQEEIFAGAVYELEHQINGVTLKFQLDDIPVYDSIEEIGPTQVHNGISITAVAEQKEDGIAVELYSINKSPYQIWSYMASTLGAYQGKDLHLKAGDQVIPYEPLGGHGDAHSSFFFKVNPDQAQEPLTLEIPYMSVLAKDGATVKLPLPATKEKEAVNMEIPLQDGVLFIDEVERVESHNDYGDLRIRFHFEPNQENVILRELHFTQVSRTGKFISGGGSYEVDENGIMQYCDFALEANDKGSLRLQISRLEYYLLDGYSLALEL